jgi:hypothetical protein
MISENKSLRKNVLIGVISSHFDDVYVVCFILNLFLVKDIVGLFTKLK